MDLRQKRKSLLLPNDFQVLNKASSSQYGLLAITIWPATDLLIASSSSVSNWLFATERVTQFNDFVQAGTTFTVSMKTATSKTSQLVRQV
jgi:hypothetical protein